MDLDRFLNLLCAVFGAIGSWYVLKTATELSPDLIAVLSRTNWGFSLAQIDALSQQKADSIVGTLLIAIALVFAVIAAVAPPGIRLFKKRVVAIGIAFAAASAGYAFCYVLGSAIQRDQKLAAGRYIEKHELQTLFSRGRLQKNELITDPVSFPLST